MRYFEATAFLLFVWMYRFISCEEDSFSEIMSDPPDHSYFNKYGHCSVSMGRLQDAYHVEGELVAAIKQAYEYLPYNKVDKVNARDYEDLDKNIKNKIAHISSAREKENSTEALTNHPLNGLHFLRRVVFHFNPLFNEIFTSKSLIKRIFYIDLSALIDKFIREESSCWPTSKDIQVAITSLARIIKTYKLSKPDLIKGNIMGRLSIEPLKLDEIIVLIQEANRRNYYSDVLEWTEFVFNHPEFHIEKNKNNLKNLIRLRAVAMFQSKQKSDSIDYLKKVIKENKFDTKLLQRDLKFYESQLKEDTSSSDNLKDKIIADSEALCRKDRNSSTGNNLRCFYRRNRKGWDRTKIELLNINPPIYKYYGIVKDEDIHGILNLVKTTKTKLHLYKQKGEVSTDTVHSKEETVFWDEDHDIMKHLSKRVSYITGLETNNHKYNTILSSSGPFKIINYGIGGFEESQVDYLKKEGIEKKEVSVFGGDRLATWTYQLSDKVEGGRVVFPRINISIPLEQGTGLLWFNIMKNGTTNPLSEHMECPIVHGSKWIIRKYIHENGNMFTRKCYRKVQSFSRN